MPHIDLITDIAAEPDACFDLSLDVGVHLAASFSERVVGGVSEGRMKLGEHVTWSARHFGVRWRMTSRIVEYQRPHTFVDEMERGPFGHWRHQHIFEKTAYGTRMTDHVAFASPFGPLGRLVDALVLQRYMTNSCVSTTLMCEPWPKAPWRDRRDVGVAPWTLGVQEG